MTCLSWLFNGRSQYSQLRYKIASLPSDSLLYPEWAAISSNSAFVTGAA
ncbi:hypothetical protein BN1221_03010 [Brenneria goodwinii]|uniref:Uncharacterized protein n=1 Tax=Brenneria goodwinii TaxID=1109412 RepID=A0A0G4JXD8_9GAMM|nr:hypothetical protein BN1221_03010 [Brenneria goodwinii]